MKFDSGGRQLGELEGEPQAKKAKTEPPAEEAASGAASSGHSGPSTLRRRLATKQAPNGQPDAGEPSAKEARKDDDAAMDCLAGMVAEAVDYTGKVLTAVNDTLHEDEPEMTLKTLSPTTAGGKDERNQEH